MHTALTSPITDAALVRLNMLVSDTKSLLLCIYSESPFLRPKRSLRRCQFAVPAVMAPVPLPEQTYVRYLVEQADMAAPLLASARGFHTGYLVHTFHLVLDADARRALSNGSRRVVLRLAFLWPGLADLSTASASTLPANAVPRVGPKEVLPRCLTVRVGNASAPIPLLDPFVHGGQGRKLGHRVATSIDISNAVRCNYCLFV